jgi:autotransporter-associated beta strand protein
LATTKCGFACVIIPNASEALSFTKADGGLWILNPLDSNDYTGTTTISGGALRAITTGSVLGIPTNSNITLSGGVLEVAGTSFTRTLGTGAGQVQLTAGSTGFAAGTTDRLVVNLSSGAALTWGTGSFNPATALVLGSSTALGETEITNNINLGTAGRTVTVNANGNTGTMVTAGILSGVISGGAGGNLTKNGGGVLMLGNANTYVGNTTISDGTLVLTSIGAAGATFSSLGTNVSGGSLILNRTGDLNAFIYVGEGETSTRPWSLQGDLTNANRIYRVDSSGSGALVLGGTFTNTQTRDATVRTLVLELRGSNTDNNMITSQLINSTNGTNPALLAITKNDGGTWILNPSTANTFSGALTVSGGNLGLTSNGIGAATAISMGNAGIFAFGGPLNTSAIITGNNATAVIAGQNSITVGGMTKTSGNNQWTISNNLENGALLTVNGNFVNNEAGTTAATQTINIRGYGSTLWNGAITENVALGGKTAWNIAIAPDASFTMSGAANTYTGATTLSQGRLILNKTAGANPLGTTSSFAFNGGELQGSFALIGTSAISTPITLGGDPVTFSGNNSIELSSATALSMAASRLLVNDISGGGSLTISGSISNTAASTLTVLGSGNTTLSGIYAAGTGANGLTMSGTGTFTATGANTATGLLTANRGTISLAGANGAWSTAGNTFTLNANGTLQLDNSVTNNNNRMLDGGAVTFNGGTISLIGNTTTETAGALTVNGIMGTISMSGIGSNTLTFGTTNFANSGSSLDLSSIASLGVNNKVLLGTIQLGGSGFSNPILNRIMINGDFARYDVTNGVVAFSAYNVTNILNTAAATDTMSVTASAGLNISRTLNALKIDGSGLTVGTAGSILTLTAGSILNTGGNNTLTAAQIAFPNIGVIQVESGTTLDVNGAFTGIINKAGAGQLNLNTQQFYNSTTNVSGGTLTLKGGLNTLFANGAAVGGALQLDLGATLDLNGNTQYVGTLSSPGSALPSTGGTVTSTTGTPTLITRDGGAFGGQITGGINFVKTGANAQTFSMAQTYTGTTSILGQTITLENDGTLANTSAIEINYAGLNLSNNTSLQTQNNNRINDAAPITMRGGTLSVTGRVAAIATETFGAVSLAQGANTITATTGAGTIASVDLNFGALTRTAGATINFTGTNLGQQGNNARIVFASTPAVLGSGILGAWAIANSTDYAAYNAGQGVGIVGQGGFTGYDAQVIAAANVAPVAGTFASGNMTNIVSTANSSLLLSAGTTTTGLLRVGGAFTTSVNFTNDTDILNLELGGILRSDNNNATTIGTTAIRGIIMSGTSELVVYNNQNTVTINSVIDGATSLIKDGAGTLSLSAPNTYSLGTIVNRGTLNLNGAASAVVIPGNLTINGGVTGSGATVAMITNAGQIAATSNVTINGQGTLTLVGNNTLNGLALHNIGGNVSNPTLNVGGILTLSSTSPITATSSNAATTSTITGGTVALASGANTFNIAPIAIGGQTYTVVQPTLTVASVIANGASPSSISKTGNGILLLSGANTFSGGTTVTAGGIMLGAAGTGISAGTGANAVTGPLGAGSVSMAANTAFLTNDADRTIFNPVTFAGTPTFRNTTTGTTRTITLGGALTTPNALTVNVDNPFLTASFAGEFTNAATITGITKTGLGNLVVNMTGMGAATPVSLSDGGTLGILHDGDGDVQNGEVLNVGALTFSTTAPTLTIGRAGTSVLWNQAINKIIAPASINSVNNGLTVNNNNQYQLNVGDAIALGVAGVDLSAAPIFSVATANNSNTLDGLRLSGIVSGGATGAANVVLTKSGLGTMALTGVNTFGGSSAIIDVTAGILSVNANIGLGDASNVVRLSANSGTQGLRLGNDGITTSYTLTGRTINLNAATVGIDVTAGTTVTLDTPFTFGAAGNALQKNDLGNLIVTANNNARSGATTIVSGVVQIDNVNALGSGQINVAAPGTNTSQGGGALWLTNNINLASPINLATGGGNGFGINNTGAVFSASGNNTLSGSITNTSAVGITLGAASGATLNITAGAMANTNSPTFNAVGTGIINLAGYTPNTAVFAKIGTGTLNLTGTASSTAAITVTKGTLNVSGSGAFTGTTGNIIVQNNALLNVDDTGTATTRIAGTARTMNLNNGNFAFTGNGGAASALSFGALTSAWGGNTLTLNNAGASNATLTFASLAAIGGGSVLTLATPQTFNNTTNQLIFTALAPQTNGIITRTVVREGVGVTNFATQSAAAAPITAFSAYSNVDGSSIGSVNNISFANFNGGTAYGMNAQAYNGTNTLRITDDTVALSNPGLNNRRTNALKIEGTNTDVTFATSGGTQLYIGSGNILSVGAGQTLGNATLRALGSAPAIAFGTLNETNTPPAAAALVLTSVEGGILVDTGASLTIEAALFNTANVTKGLGGNLTFATKQFFNAGANAFTINGGTVTLDGGENTLWQGVQGGTNGQLLSVGPGATLNLNGNSQMVGDLVSPNRTAFAGSGGSITSSSATTLLAVYANATAGQWGGNISGNIFFNKAGATATTFYSDNTYTGGTLINGGTLTLIDEGRLSGTTSITINNAALALSDAGTMANDNRINDAATISMRGGNLSLTGRDLWNSSEIVGAITLAGAQNNLTATVATNGTVRSAVLEIGNLTQANYSTLLWGAASGQMGSAGRIIIANGSSLLVNGIIPWATDGGTFASYVAPTSGNAAGGLAALNQLGYQGYDASIIPAGSGTTTQNLRLGSASFVVPDVNIGSAGTYNANAVAFNTSANSQTLSFADNADTLNLNSGGLIVSGNFTGKTIGSAVGNGFLTSGGTQSSGIAPLFLTQNQGTAIVNSSIVNNGNGAATRFVYTPFNGAVITFNAANTYTGGTQLNGNVSHTGTLALNLTGANGTTSVAIPAGDLEINNATVRLDQASQIHTSVVPVLHGAGGLNLNNFNQTLAGLSFINNGSSTAASVTTGTGILTLTGGITATSSNVGSVSTISGAGTGGIALDLNGANRTFNVAPVTVNGNTTIANVTPTLAISAPIGDSAVSGAGLIKSGNGLLQLSGASLFTGGVNVTAGGLAIAGNSTGTRDALGVVTGFTNGPVGIGTLTLATGTFLTADATARTLNNDYILGSTLGFRGTGNLTLNGATTLTGNTTFTVDAPQAVLTLNGLIDDGGLTFGITKEGLGTLLLGNNNTFTGGVTVNAGTLALAGLNAGSTAPVFTGTTATIGNGGMLSLLNSGTGSLGLISYANNIVVNPAAIAANLHVGNNGANTANTIEVGGLTLNGGQILNVSSQNGYNLRLLNITSSGSGVPQINVNAGARVVVFGFTAGFQPINVGQGELVFPDLVTIGQTNTLAADVTLSGSYPLGVQNRTFNATDLASFNLSPGGLNGSFATVSSAPAGVVVPQVAGIGFTGSNFLTTGLADGSYGNRPSTITGTAANTTAAFSGQINITTAGTYTFRSGTDDGMTLFINGNAVATDAFGHAFTDSAAVSVPLTAGYHSIVYKFTNGGTGGGYRLLYSGADTGGSFQSIAATNLVGTTNLPTAANGFNGAAIINNNYSLPTGSATIDTFGTQFGAVIDPSKVLTLGANTQLNIVNGSNGSFGTGWFGAGGASSIGTGAIINTGNTATASAGTLQLLGAVTQSGTGLTSGIGTSNALIKTGQGTLVLGGNNTATFTGDLAIQGGTVALNNAGALPTGVTTVSNTTLAAQAAATTTAGSAAITDITSTASMQKGMAITGTGIPTGSYIVSVDSATAITISQNATAPGTITNLVASSSATLDLNGQTNVLGNVTINGFGAAPMGANTAAAYNFNGALWNSSSNAASLTGSLTLGSSSSVGGNGDLTLGVINSVAGANLIKTGTGTLNLNTANNTALLGGISVNTGGILKLGDANALGSSAGATTTISGTTAVGTAVTELASTAGLYVGQPISGGTIPAGTVIASITSGTAITLSQAATAVGAVTLTVGTNTTGIASGAVLDLNGISTAEPLAIFGAGRTNFTAARNTLGSVINTAAGTSILSGTLTLGAASSIGSDWINATSGGSAGGAITLNGGVNGGFLLTKVGNNTLNLTGANTQNGLTITQGNVVISGAAGVAGSGGNVTINPGTASGLTLGNVLTLNNSAGVLTNRLGGASRALLQQGGGLVITGNASSAMNEQVGGILLNNAFNLITLDNAGRNVTLSTPNATAIAATGSVTTANSPTVTGLSTTAGMLPGMAVTGTNIPAGSVIVSVNSASSITISQNASAAGTAITVTASGGSLVRTNNATTLIRGANLGTAQANGTTNVILGSLPGTNNLIVGQTGANNALTRAIMPSIIVDTSASGSGTSFGVVDAAGGTIGIRPLNGTTEMSTPAAAGSVVANNNNRINNAGVTLGIAATGLTTTLVNSLTINSGGSLVINALRNLDLDSGGLLATASATISTSGAGISQGTLRTPSNRELIIHTAASTTTLTIDAALSGALAPTQGGLTKSGEGTLVLNSAIGNSYIGTTTLNLGTVQLGASAPQNALFYQFSTGPAINATASAQVGNALVSNSGSTLDLNGKSQVTGDLLSRGSLVGSGGIITNTSGTLATYTTTIGTARDFAGQINGNLNFVRTGANVLLSLRDNNQFTGNATLMSGITSLIDQGTFSGMGAGDTISIRNALLRWDDSGIQELNNRIASTVALSLDGGAFDYISRGAMTDSITLGDLSVTGGTATLRVNPGNGGFGSATLNLGGTFTRSTGATLNFASGAGIIGAGANITATAAGLTTNTNGILGGWATVNSNNGTSGANLEFARYDPVAGIRPINNLEQTATFLASTSTSNLRLGNADQIVPNGGSTINSLTWNGFSAARTMTFAGPGVDTLTLASGGLLFGTEAFARTIGAATSAATRGRITSSGSELFIHNGGNTLTIHSDITGTTNPVFTSGGTNGGATIVLNNTNSYVGTAYANGVILNLGLAPVAAVNFVPSATTNAITGDLILTGGNINGTGSGLIANSAVRLQAANQINDLSNITVRGGSQLDLNGFNDTIANLTFNSQGGYNDGGPLVQTGAGRLTLTGNITATNLDDVRAVPTISGNIALGASPTITVGQVTGTRVLGTRGDFNEQIGLTLNANITGGATITKAGNGALQLGGTSQSVTAINVTAGSVITGAATNYSNATIDLASGTILDTRGVAMTGRIGNVTGTGIIKNFSPTAGGTLVTGSANTDAIFDGTLASDYTSGLLSVTKVGTGNWNLTANNSANILGTLQINGGSVTLDSSTARVGFVTTILAEGGTLTLNNSTNVLGNRLGGTTSVQATTADRAISMRGGILDFRGGGSAVVEAVNTITNLEGASRFALTSSGFGTSITAVSVAASSTTNRGTLTLDAGSGLLGGAAAGSGRVNVIASTLANANLLNNIRPDMIGIDSSGTGFVTHDANGFRLLTSADTALGYVNPTGTYLGSATPLTITATAGTVSNVTANTSNVDVTTALGLHGSTTINSLNLSSGGGLTSIGGGVAIATSPTTLFNAAGTVNTLSLNSTAAGSGAILAETGNLGITGGALQAGTGTGLLIYHTPGNLTSSAYVLGSGGIVKNGTGTLNLNQRSLNTGSTFVNEGTLVLGGGANTLLVVPTAAAAGVADLVANSGTIKLNGNNQAFRQITQTTANNLPNTAGTIVNDSAVAANLYTAQSVATTFAGTLGVNGGTANENNFSVDKAGNFAWTLTGAQYYTGATNIRAGTLTLQDSGAITGGGAINANFATLSLINSGLSHVVARTGTSAINLTGGTLSLTPRLESETSATAGAITLLGGQNNINIAAQPGIGGSLNLSAGALTRTAGSGAVLTMSSATGQIGRGVAANAGQSGQVTFSNGASILTNNIIGGWATNGVDFLTYLNTASASGAVGVGLLGDTGSGFLDYTTRITAAGNLTSAASNNTLVSGNFNTNVNGNTSLNSLAHATGATGNNLTFTAQTDTLTLTSGGYAKSGNFTGAIGQNVDVGRLTSSGAELFIHNNQSTLTINSRITGTNRVVFSSVGGGTIALANGTSTLQNAATVTGTNAQVTSTTNMFVGQTVAGPGGYTGTITAIVDGTNVTLSGSPTAGNGFYSFGAVGTSAITGATNTNGSATVTFTIARPGLFVGQPIFGTGVPLGATISAISADGLTVTMSAASTAAVTAFTAGSAGHSYSGGTVVNNGATLQLNSARAGEVVIPAAGGLTINGGAVTMGSTSISGAIASGTNVTITGNGSLTYPAYVVTSPLTAITNTLGSVTFNGNGGAGNPTLALGTPAATQLHRVVVSGITSVNDNLSQVPTISGGAGASLQFSTTTPTITVNAGANIAGLQIAAQISNNADVVAAGAITKAGLGGLVLTSATSNWTTGLNLDAGTLIIGAASTPTTAITVAAPIAVTAGPLGTGTLRIADGTTIQTDNTARTVSNAIAFSGAGATGFTIGGTAATHNLTLNGVVDFGAFARTITVSSPQTTATIGGQITGSAGGLTKAGNGILVLSQTANDYAGTTTINGGMLQLGAANVIPNGSALAVNSGGTFNIAGFAETVASLSSGSTTTGGLITNSGAAATLTIDNTTGTTTFGGVISNGTNALNLAKLGASTQVLTNQNTYTGTTTVTGGVLEIGTGGSLRGTSALNLNTGGNFRISRATDNVVSFTNPSTFTPVNFQTSGATLSLANALTGNNQRFGALTFSASAPGTLDFGTGTTNSLTFASLAGSANGVNVANWTGSVYPLSATIDNGDLTQDRLLFTTNPGFTANTVLSQFIFTNDAGDLIGKGLQVSGPFSTFTIVPTADATAYWSGNRGTNSWTDVSGLNTNWWTSAAGTTVATVPGPGTNVFMSADTPTNFFATTNLNQNMSINSLTFTGTGTANTAGSIIASGSGTNALTLNATGGNGISVAAGSGANTITANVILGATQTWTNDSASLLTLSGNVSGANTSLTVAGVGDTTISGSVLLGSGTVTKNGAGVLLLSAANNDYSGATTINAGTLQVTKLADGGSVSSIGGSSNAAANLVFNGGALSYTGAGDSTDRQFTLGTGGGTLTASGVGALNFTNPAAITLAGTDTARTFTLSGSNTGLNTLAGTLGDNGTGATSFAKSGAGTWVLSGTSTFSGTSTITGGQLQVTGALSGTGNVSVSGTTLAGSGSIAGSTTISSGSILAPGVGANLDTSNQALNFTGSGTSLTVNSGATVRLGITSETFLDAAFISGLGGTYANAASYLIENPSMLASWNANAGDRDFINATGNVSLGSGGGTITVFTTGAFTPVNGQVFNLMDWAGLTGTFNPSTTDLTLPDLSGLSLSWDTSAFASHGVIVSVPEPSRAILLLLGLLGLMLRRRRR